MYLKACFGREYKGALIVLFGKNKGMRTKKGMGTFSKIIKGRRLFSENYFPKPGLGK